MARYYLAYGDNAVAVVQTWAHLNRIRKYFIGFNCRGYDAYDEANADGLEHLAEIAPSYLPLPEHLDLGRVVAVSSLNRAYLASEGKEEAQTKSQV